jgi:hypothetical protein
MNVTSPTSASDPVADNVEVMSGTSPQSRQELELELVLLKRKKNELLQQRVEIVEDFGLLSYKPHPKQDRFHRMGAKSRRGAFCGNRFGKSTMSCAEDCGWLMGERVWYPRTDPARYVGLPQRPVKGLVLTTDWGKVDEIWTSERGDRPGKLWTMLPTDFVKSKRRNHAGCISEVECVNGSTLSFDVVEAWKRNPMSQESSDWDFINVDEPIPQQMWKGNARGLVDRGGFAWFTLTALTELWILDYFFPPTVGKRNLPLEYDADMKWAIRGSIYDNPYLSAAGRKQFEDDLTQDERECRLHGIPMELSGLVYKEFDWDKHVYHNVPGGWDGFNQPPRDWPVYLHIDPHPRTPHAVLFLTLDPTERRFFFDEIFVHCTISELSKMIRVKMHGRHVARIKCDPLAWINDPITGDTMAYEFHKHGLLVEKATKALHLGIMRVQDELSKPGFVYVNPNLQEFHFEIQRYVWDAKRKGPVDENDHMMEGMYRLLLDDPRYVDLGDLQRQGPIEDLLITGADLNLRNVDFDEVRKKVRR